MSVLSGSLETHGPVLQAHLLGRVDYEALLSLQNRLVFEVSGLDDGSIVLLLCEHPPLITIGRSGSRGHIRCDDRELLARKLPLRFVNRGGGAILHGPAQLAVSCIVPLHWYGLSVGDYLRRLHTGVKAALGELKIPVHSPDNSYDLRGRTGQLGWIGIAVKSWTSYHGLYLNVSPARHPVGLFGSARGEQAISSLSVERQQPVRIQRLRESLIRHLAGSLGVSRYNVTSGHPLLPRTSWTHETITSARTVGRRTLP